MLFRLVSIVEVCLLKVFYLHRCAKGVSKYRCLLCYDDSYSFFVRVLGAGLRDYVLLFLFLLHYLRVFLHLESFLAYFSRVVLGVEGLNRG